MRAYQIPLHWLAVSQVNPDIILTKINKRWVPFFKHSCSWSHKTQKLAGGGFQAGDRASTPLQCSSCLWPSCSPGLASPGLPSTTLASYPLDCHRSLRIFWRRNILHHWLWPSKCSLQADNNSKILQYKPLSPTAATHDNFNKITMQQNKTHPRNFPQSVL